MQIRNLTPHTLNIHVAEFQDRAAYVMSIPPYAPKGAEARVSVVAKLVDSAAAEVPLVAHSYGPVVGLPAPEEGVLLVVSAMVRLALPGRHDLASPGDMVRDAEEKVIGCRNLIVNV